MPFYVPLPVLPFTQHHPPPGPASASQVWAPSERARVLCGFRSFFELRVENEGICDSPAVPLCVQGYAQPQETGGAVGQGGRSGWLRVSDLDPGARAGQIAAGCNPTIPGGGVAAVGWEATKAALGGLWLLRQSRCVV